MRDSFLRQTAESIVRTVGWKDMSKVTFILPSHRAGLVLTDELLTIQAEQGVKAVWSPRVQTLTQLQDALSPLYAEDELMTIVRLYTLYQRMAESGGRTADDMMPLDMFYGWGRQMVADFTNIDASMDAEEVPNFFANTIAAHELSQWQLDTETENRLRALINPTETKRPASESDTPSVKSQYEVIWRNLYELYKALHAGMEAESKGYAGMRQRAVLEHWEDEQVQSQLAGRTFIFVGFNYLLPVERELMQRLKEAGQALFYWDYVPDFRTNEKAFYFAKLNSGILGDNGFHTVSPVPRRPSPVTLISCSSREAQAQYVHRWLQENYTRKGQRVGVVICDETMLEPVIYTLPAITLDGADAPEPVNITKGFPLRNTAIYARVLAWLNDRARGDAEQVLSPDFIGQMLDALFPVTEDPSPATDTPSPLKWQELLILESGYQVRKIANQMRLLLANGLGGTPFTLRLLRLLMRRTMESVSMPFHGEPVTDIQVMGVLETRMLDFDRLLLLNVEEGVLPQQQTDISFIPYYLRKAYHMQTSDERATVYAYNFFRLLSRSGHATLLYASADTTEGGKGMSRFVMQMIYSPEFEVKRVTLQEPSVLTSFADNRSPVAQTSLLSKLVADHGVLRRPDGRRYRISPSALNTYISCPYSFYLQYILGLQPQEEEEVLFAPNTLGSFVHHAMEYIYRTYFHCDNRTPVRVTPEQVEAVRTDERKMQEALDAAYAAMNEAAAQREPADSGRQRYIPEHHTGENVVIKGYVSNILERDREDAKVGLQLYMLEKECLFPVTISGVGELLTGGIVDRLDMYGAPGQEYLRVVDYKSGGYNETTHAKKMSSSWEQMMESEDKGYVRQTLIYSHAVMSQTSSSVPLEPHLYFCRRKMTDITTTLEIEGETLHDYRQIHPLFYEALRNKIEQVLTATSFPKCDEDKCPSFCPFFALCGRKAVEY